MHSSNHLKPSTITPELCSLCKATDYSGNYAGTLATSLIVSACEVNEGITYSPSYRYTSHRYPWPFPEQHRRIYIFQKQFSWVWHFLMYRAPPQLFLQVWNYTHTNTQTWLHNTSKISTTMQEVSVILMYMSKLINIGSVWLCKNRHLPANLMLSSSL